MPKTAIPSRRLPSAVPILFYGTNNFAWLHGADIKPFDEGNAPDTPKKQAGKLLEAIRLAKEDEAPTGRLPSFTEQDSTVDDEEFAESSDEEEEDSSGAKRKKRHASASKKPVVKATPKARKTPQTPKISRTPAPASSGTSTTKRKATPVTGSSKRKKVQRDEDVEMRESGIDAVQMVKPKKSIKELKKNCM
ncbi:MAG: hypothetical protein BJ554DRAFT_4897 [Olpidium bornovanus]|uniref:PWWP domain-containing protein n=1 Tax=Olpidium bornovanus TaxID=278681 RepID=A0A8H7ZKD3_9FUNG|nr:MAG: hypothetical protein BJ554DRAFT_4897 [Olpidium bornovanus]